MKNRAVRFIGIVGFVFLLLAVLPSILIAGEYGYTYEFRHPTIINLSNGLQILKLEGTRQKDAVIGAPILPVRTAKIFIPAEEKVTSININPGRLKTIEGAYIIQHATRPYPITYKGPIELDEPDPVIYSTDTDYPSVIQVERGSQFLCGTQIVMVDLSPVMYNPLKGQLKYYEQIEVTIQTTWQGRPMGVMPFRNRLEDRKQILRTIDNKTDFLLQNPAPQGQNSLSPLSMEQPSGGAEIVGPTGLRDYVVITTSGMVTAFQALTNHRQSTAGGSFTTHIEDIANIRINYPGSDDAEKMRNFIRDMYLNYDTIYVVLGGDCDGPHGSQTISTRGCYAMVNGGYPPDDDPDHYIPSDLYFGCLDGTWNSDGDALWGESNDGIGGGDIDWYSEVYVGRIPADTSTEATNQINKIIAYETGTSPYKTLLVGESLDAVPTWGGDRMDWVHSYMDSMPNTKLYDRDGTWVKSTLLSHINSNSHNWLNHLGHGNPSWNMKLANVDIASMTNSQHFFHYSQACYSGSIDGRRGGGNYGSECILEDMVNSNNHGAFAIIGNSRYGWYNPGAFVEGASNRVHKEFVEAIFSEGYKRLGEANQRSKPDLDLSQGVYRWIAFETNLLGCPVTQMATQPEEDECTLINDGSFENGPPPASAWTMEADPVDCDGLWILDPASGWGINAYDETYAYWAGGFCGSFPSSDYVEQSISVPANATTLRFYTVFYRPAADDTSPNDYFYVKINGNTIFTRTMNKDNDTYPNWVEQSVDISAYAGTTVTLRFEGLSVGDGVTDFTGNVLVDYIRTCVEDGECVEGDSGQLDIVGKAGGPGTTMTVPVRIQSAPNGVASLGFEVTYNTGILDYVGYTRGDCVTGFDFFDVSEPESGRLIVGGFEAGGDTIPAGASCIVVNLEFAVSTCEQGMDFTLAELQGLVDDLAGWTTSGACFQCGCSCDVNGDGDITPVDALCAFQKYLAICPTSCGPCEDICCDVTMDGDCTPADALEIFKEYLGLPSMCSPE